MDSSTTIVNVNPEQLEKLVEFMSGVVGTSLAKPTSTAEFAALMCAQASALIDGADEADAEGCFQVLFKDIQLEADGAVTTKAVESVTAVLTANTTDKPALRVRILANLYNVLSSSSSRAFVGVLLAIIKYAGTVGQVSFLLGYFDLLDDLVLKWALSVEEARSIFLEVSTALDSAGAPDKAQVFLVKHLATFSSGSAVGPSTKALAAKGAVGAVSSPIASFTERHNLLGLAAVQSLKGDAEHGALFQLLTVFATGKLSDYKAFVAKNASVVGKYGLDGDACVKSMRLLSLCSLATQQSEMPYAAVAADLEVGESDVEEWVCACISAGLIDAKMDQERQVVLVSRAAHRVFGKAEWVALQKKLQGWKANLKQVLGTLNKTQALAQP